MSLLPRGGTWVATIIITDSPKSEPRYLLGYGDTPDSAVKQCRELAMSEGWAAPSWWQWWRRKDSKEPFPSPAL